MNPSHLFSLNVFIEINGAMVKAGTISGTTSTDARFCYDDAYLSNPLYRPISISLPFSKTAFSPDATRNYFEGLLPEGFTRKTIADAMHLDSEDYVTILKELGKECLGAIQIVDESEGAIQTGYKELSEDEVQVLAAEGTSKAANLVIESHLSLTGASGKTGLYYDQKMEKWFQPFGTAPSNYIVKQSHVRLKNIIVNERLCLMTARKLGIETAESFIVQIGQKTDDTAILLATKRFDRYTDAESKQIGCLTVPYRLHQEDFAQALGIKSAYKYERPGDHYLKQMFSILRSQSANPVEDQLKLWRICVFNCFIGNTDNHIKNYSLLYSKNLRTIRLAPCYDIISTRVYKGMSEMSLSINGKLYIEDITRADFEAEARLVGLGTKLAMRIYDEIQSGFATALKESAQILTQQGFQEAELIATQILNCNLS